ncbi:MAG: O-antigen ligase family protein [Acidobacteria bacterium]|nr:O-antigen ligase family protein [Acidobacteriota bacterium]
MRGRAALLTLALTALFLACALHASGGLQLQTLTRVEVGLDAIAGVLAILALLTGRRGEKPWGMVSLGLFGLLVVLTGISILWAIDPGAAWIETNRTFALLGAFVIGFSLVRLAPDRWRCLLGAVLLASVIVSAYALLTKVFPGSFAADEVYGRLREPYGYWNAVGLTAAVGIPVAAWLGARRDGHGALAALAYPVAGLLTVATLLAFSRGSLLAALLGLVVWFALVPLRLRSATVLIPSVGLGIVVGVWAFSQNGLTDDRVPLNLRGNAGTELGVALLVLVVVLLITGVVTAWLRDRKAWGSSTRRGWGVVLLVCLALVPIAGAAILATSERGFGGSVSKAWNDLTDPNAKAPKNDPGRLTSAGSVRSRYWRDAIAIFRARPAVGVGAGGYVDARLRVREDDLDVLHAHGYLVQTAADLGAVGLAVTLALLAAWLAAAIRATGRWRGPRPREWGDERIGLMALLTVVVVFGVHSFIDWTWFIPGTAVPALACAGWLASRGAPAGLLPLERRWRDRLRASLRSPWRVLATVLMFAITLAVIWSTVQPQRAVNKDETAIDYLSKGELVKAEGEAQSAVSTNPLAVEPLFTLAAVQIKNGNPPAARATLRKAVKLQPAVAETWIRLATFELNTAKDPAAATAALQPALFLDPRSTVARATFLLALRAEEKAKKKDRKKN